MGLLHFRYGSGFNIKKQSFTADKSSFTDTPHITCGVHGNNIPPLNQYRHIHSKFRQENIENRWAIYEVNEVSQFVR